MTEPTKQDRVVAAGIAERFTRAVETHRYLLRTGSQTTAPDLAEFLAHELAAIKTAERT